MVRDTFENLGPAGGGATPYLGWTSTLRRISMSECVVQVQNLRKVFVSPWTRKRTVAVDDVSFEVFAGEVFGFLGPNGAGKTTTLKMLMGLLHPSSGHATLLGHPAGAQQAKALVGYLPENPYFYDYLSAREFLNMVGRIYKMRGPARKDRVEMLLDRVGLGVAKGRAMRSYSKGMLQRVGLAQALMSEPSLVVLDEPMSGLDPVGRREVRDLIEELRDAGHTVIFCTHILADAEQLCDRVAMIVKGKIRQIGTMDEVLGQSVHRVDLQFSGIKEIPESLVELFTGDAKQNGSTWSAATTGQAQASKACAEIVAAGGEVLSLVPHRQTLEEVFVRDASGPAHELRS